MSENSTQFWRLLSRHNIRFHRFSHTRIPLTLHPPHHPTSDTSGPYPWMLFKSHLINVSKHYYHSQLSSVAQLGHVQLFATPWTVAYQASLSITKSWRLFKLMSIKLVMSFNHLFLCHPLLLLPSVFPSIKVFSNESVLCMMWAKYWNSYEYWTSYKPSLFSAVNIYLFLLSKFSNVIFYSWNNF